MTDVGMSGFANKDHMIASLLTERVSLCSAIENLLRQFDALQVPVKHPNQAAERAEARAVLKMARGES